MIDNKHHYFECRCDSYEHTFRVSTDKVEGDAFFDVTLNRWLPWYKRVWYALLFVFNRDTGNWYPYDAVWLSNEDVNRLIEVLSSANDKVSLDK
jgi:hypothetical protein